MGSGSFSPIIKYFGEKMFFATIMKYFWEKNIVATVIIHFGEKKFFATIIKYFGEKMPNQVFNSNNVENFKFDNFRNNGNKKNLRQHFKKIFLTEFDIYIDIVLIVYIFCVKILF